MRQTGLVGARHRRGGPTTTRGDQEVRPAPDLVDRSFTADEPSRLRVADIIDIPTRAGFLYPAIVLDAFSCRIVGWSMADHLRTALVLDAFEMAVGQGRPRNVIHHSDQSSQYTSPAFGNRCREAGVRPSMGSVGDAQGNAMAESFFSTLECEFHARRRFQSRPEARMALFSDFEGFYDPVRRRSALGYRSPLVYEQEHRPKTRDRDPGQPSPIAFHRNGAIPSAAWPATTIACPPPLPDYTSSSSTSCCPKGRRLRCSP